MKNFTFLILIVFAAQLGFSQKGPGGVENADGTTSLVLWLDANKEVSTSSSKVSSWGDLSGYNNDATQTSSWRRPILRSSAINSLDAIDFDGFNDYLRVSDDNSLDLSEWDIFIVTKVDIDKDCNAFMVKGDDADENYELISYGNGCYHTAIAFTDNTRNYVNTSTGATSSTFSIINYSYSSSIGRDVYKNATSIYTDNISKTPKPSSLDLLIGNESGIWGRYLNGAIAEIIVFNRKLNPSENIIINNYLAAKYNITLGANDLFVQDNSGNGNYDFDVAGIGRISSTDLLNNSQGTGIVRITNPKGLDDNEFLFWGHNNGELSAIETTDVPSGIQARFDRVWRVSEVNTSGNQVSVGDIDIFFDLSNLGSITTSDLRLLIDTDMDGDFDDETPISDASDEGGDIYSFSDISDIDNNMIFTIATKNKSQTPLPVDLISFDVENINNEYVNIKWTTASELNNDYFDIEKSIDLVAWEPINSIAGAGNSNSIINYEVVDNDPYKGIAYYRLKQVDYDGNFEYSDIKTVLIKNEKADIVAYPNPFKNILTINNPVKDINSIKVFNELGQEVTNSVNIKTNDKEIILDFSKLYSGIFFITADGFTSKVYKE